MNSLHEIICRKLSWLWLFLTFVKSLLMRKNCKKSFFKSPQEHFVFFAENLRQRPQKLEYECNIFFKIFSLLHIQSTVHIPQLSILTSTFKCTLACVYGRWFSLCKTIPQYSLHPPLSTSQRSTTTQVLCCLQNCLKLNTWWIY